MAKVTELHDEIYAERIGAAARALRALSGEKQIDVAERMGITDTTLRKVEEGDRVALHYMPRLCSAYLVSLGELERLMELYATLAIRQGGGIDG